MSKLSRLPHVALLLVLLCLPACDDDEAPPVGESVPVLAVVPTNRDVPLVAGSTTFSVDNTGMRGMDWVAGESCDWVDLSLASGTDDGPIVADYAQNPGSSTRVCQITVTADGAIDSPRTLTITQDGNLAAQSILAVWPQHPIVCDQLGTQVYQVANDGQGLMVWTASTDCDYVTLSDNLGANNGTFTASWSVDVTVQFSCQITITADGAENSPQTVTLLRIWP